MIDNIEVGDKLKIHCYKHNGKLHQLCDEAVVLYSDDDGKTWVDKAGSPVELKHLADKTLKVGCYHTTSSDNEGWAAFDDFNLWQKK